MNPVEAIKARRSVRTYAAKAISKPHEDSVKAALEKLSGEYGVGLAFVKNDIEGKQFGTYGIIKHAQAYMACTCKTERSSLLNAGIALEKAIIHCTGLGIGTCWLGGTFKRDEFESALPVAEDEVIPAVISAGYPAEREGIVGGLMRVGAGSNARKPFETLFFDRQFSTPLSRSDAMAAALEAVRLGPSASNKQPWRVVADESGYHFYLEHTPGYANGRAFDIQLVDMGIAMAHFELAAQTEGKNGSWQTLDRDGGALPQNTEYIASWVFVK